MLKSEMEQEATLVDNSQFMVHFNTEAASPGQMSFLNVMPKLRKGIELAAHICKYILKKAAFMAKELLKVLAKFARTF